VRFTRLEEKLNFSKNLRCLCDRQESISYVCSQVEINRQQFNKYLNGQFVPSKSNLRKISEFFGLDEDDLFSDTRCFRRLVEGLYFNSVALLRNSKELHSFIELVNENQHKVEMFAGFYDRYQYSSIYEGRILRSAFYAYMHGPFLQHFYVERFTDPEKPRKPDCAFKYHGFLFYLSDRLFSVDFESNQKNEMTFGIYAPLHRAPTRFLFGMTSGIAATMSRQPYASRVALHYSNLRLPRSYDLRRASVLSPDDSSIPTEVLDYLNSKPSMIKPG
jgi:transcriptional regulator with XRE-family HTH domain